MIKNPVGGRCEFPFASTSLQIDGKLITVIGVHPPPPVEVCGGRSTTAKTIREMQKWVSNGKLSKSVGSGRKGDYVIFAGDFNALPFNDAIKSFKGLGFTDSDEKSDNVVGGTWSPNQWIPQLARIDYIFVSNHLELLRSKTVPIYGSDHKGVIALVRTKK